MPFVRTQAMLKRMLSEPIFEWLYRVTTAGYYAKQRVADWWYYTKPIKDEENLIMRYMIKDVLPYTMVGRKGLLATYSIIVSAEANAVDGCLVECGVARGGTATLMLTTSMIKRPVISKPFCRTAWLFDSFEGLPEPTAEDGVLRKPQGKDRSSWDLAKGYCLGTQEEVEDLLFNGFGFSRDKVHLVKGWFQDTLPEYRDKVGDIAVLRIDGDWYESTKCCLENLYEQVVDGGYVILDDYALVGCRKAVDEFFGLRGRGIPEVVLDGRGGGWFRKGTVYLRCEDVDEDASTGDTDCGNDYCLPEAGKG